MGSHNPAGGIAAVDIAVCTIEKANSLLNRLMEEKKVSTLGVVVVDEMHMIGDPFRGYLLELFLTKIRFVTEQSQAAQPEQNNEKNEDGKKGNSSLIHVENHAFEGLFFSFSEGQSVCEQSQVAQPEQNNSSIYVENHVSICFANMFMFFFSFRRPICLCVSDPNSLHECNLTQFRHARKLACCRLIFHRLQTSPFNRDGQNRTNNI